MPGDVPYVMTKYGNTLFIEREDRSLPDPLVMEMLHSTLSYEHRKSEFSMGRRTITRSERRLYAIDEMNRVVTNFGFLTTLVTQLEGMGVPFEYREYPHVRARPDCYDEDWFNVRRCFEFRERQEDCLRIISQCPHGVVHAVTGFGKMAMIAMVCLLYPKARIHIVTKRLPLVKKLVEYLSVYIPDVGVINGKQKRKGKRVTVFSVGSLHHSDFDCDILIADEGHELVTEKMAGNIATYNNCRSFLMSATPHGRSDGADIRVDALFGPTIFFLPYWEAEALGLVVPIRVRWYDVIQTPNPAARFHKDQFVERRRHGIWLNNHRNDVLADLILKIPEDEQSLVLVDTVYHGIELYKRLKSRGYTLVYDTIPPGRYREYQSQGIFDRKEPLTDAEKDEHRRRFESGKGNYIATGTWSVGIDPVHLQHVVMASPSSSEFNAIQAPGRASRKNSEKAAGAGKDVKEYGTVHDLLDQFDSGFRYSAVARRRIYKSMRWLQVAARDDLEMEPPEPAAYTDVEPDEGEFWGERPEEMED